MGGYTELVADDVTDEIVPPSYFPKKKKKNEEKLMTNRHRKMMFIFMALIFVFTLVRLSPLLGKTTKR